MLNLSNLPYIPNIESKTSLSIHKLINNDELKRVLNSFNAELIDDYIYRIRVDNKYLYLVLLEENAAVYDVVYPRIELHFLLKNINTNEEKNRTLVVNDLLIRSDILKYEIERTLE